MLRLGGIPYVSLSIASRAALVALTLSLLLQARPAVAQLLPDLFKDPTDGAFDASQWLLEKRGFLLNPIIVTEPAIGYGGGATLLFFHRSKRDREAEDKGEPLGLPPSISFALGLGTETQSWLAGGGHFGTWRDDGIRYVGAVGGTGLNIDFFVGDIPLAYSLTGFFVLQDLQFRLFGSPIFFGGRFVYSYFDWKFLGGDSPPPGFAPERNDKMGGLGPELRWDTRDNILDPSSGQQFDILAMIFGPWMGGDRSFQSLDLNFRSYHQLHPRVVLALRADNKLSFGDVPFYALPSINLRGVSATRYQDDYAGVGEVELRWRFYKRWSALGFFGVGWSAGRWSRFRDEVAVPAGGGGIRYLIARQLGLNMGIDVAGSKGQAAFYFQVGGAWN
jgi:hypothetical protein